MSGGAQIVLVLLLLVLPMSALIGRRIALASLGKMVLAWVMIFAAALLLVSGHARYQALWNDGRVLLFGEDQAIVGSAVRIAMSDDGHFYGDVRVNDVAVRMLIDSGATATALSQATAEKAGVSQDTLFPAAIQTANGTISAKRGTVAELRLGAIMARDLPVVISPAFGDLDVIGMNFLSRLKSWRGEGRTLILQPATRAPA